MSDSILTLDTALKLLHSFSCIVPKKINSEEEKEELRQAISLIVELSEWENLGICADSVQEAITTLNSYLKALGYPPITDDFLQKTFPQAVYLKYNSQKQSCYLDEYSGDYRGVLISCQGEDEKITGTYGYFPLNLYF